jgi:putative ABC transport system substrate-binding protein
MGFIAPEPGDAELQQAFDSITRERAAAFIVTADPFFDSRRDRIVAFAAEYRLPTIYQFREFATAGGLMTYGISITEGYHQAGVYVGRILKGAKPAELPPFTNRSNSSWSSTSKPRGSLELKSPRT